MLSGTWRHFQREDAVTPHAPPREHGITTRSQRDPTDPIEEQLSPAVVDADLVPHDDYVELTGAGWFSYDEEYIAQENTFVQVRNIDQDHGIDTHSMNIDGMRPVTDVPLPTSYIYNSNPGRDDQLPNRVLGQTATTSSENARSARVVNVRDDRERYMAWTTLDMRPLWQNPAESGGNSQPTPDNKGGSIYSTFQRFTNLALRDVSDIRTGAPESPSTPSQHEMGAIDLDDDGDSGVVISLA